MKKSILIFTILGIIVFCLLRCTNPTKNKNVAESLSTSVDTSFTINFKPFHPTDLDSGASPKQLVEFAWEEFLALNWKSSYDKNSKRDYPDTLWTYYNEPGAYPALDVWETFAHKTELRPYSNKMLPFDNAPHYSYHDTLLPANSSTSFTLFNNLDENNEIGSCDMYAHVNVFKEKYQVLYEAKVNRSEYDYIQNNYGDTLSLHKAINNTRDNIAKFGAYYQKGMNNTCGCPVGAHVVCLPCGGGQSTGTMEIKAAWRRLTNLDDSTKFFTRNVIYYTKNAQGKVVYNNITYALIALHIIHKTQNNPAIILATWKHVDAKQDSMGSVLLNKSGNEYGGIMTPMRDSIQSITVASTNYVHSKLPAKSIWQNYRLVGVQATPTSDSTTTNFFLANYVVESDRTLNHFNGSSIANPHDHGANVLFKGNFYSMGGCQGCHGATQLKQGTDFSFVLDTVGKPVTTPDIGDKNATGKLAAYIRTFKVAEKQTLKLMNGKPHPLK